MFTVLSDLDFDTCLQFERSSHCALYPWINFLDLELFLCVISDKLEWSQIRPLLAHVIQPNDVELHIANLQILGMIHCLHRRLFEDI